MFLCLILSGSIAAQATTTTSDEDKKKEKDEKKIDDDDTTTNEDVEEPKKSWKWVIIDDIETPTEPKKMSAAKTALEGVGVFTKKNGADYLKPVVGYQLKQLNIVKEAVAQIYLAPKEFDPSKDEKQLVEERKEANYIVYYWCPCKEVKNKCGCAKKKVVKILSKK